jgi:hypothetical protein
MFQYFPHLFFAISALAGNSALEDFSTNFDELVTVRLIADEHRHGDNVGERAGALERRVNIPMPSLESRG